VLPLLFLSSKVSTIQWFSLSYLASEKAGFLLATVDGGLSMGLLHDDHQLPEEVLASNVTNGGGEFRDEREIVLLAAKSWFRMPAESPHQPLVVREHHRWPSHEYEAELADGRHHSK
jgi:hypothetical protein